MERGSAKMGFARMSDRIDDLDRKILAELQADASQSLDEIARKVGSSKTPVWNRIRRMKETGLITRQTAILDPEALGLEACFFVLVRTSEHEADWQHRFLDVLRRRIQQAQLGMGLILKEFGLVVKRRPAVIGGEVNHIAFAQTVRGDNLGGKAAHAVASG